MNLDNIEEILEFGLASEGEDFEEWYFNVLEEQIGVFKHPFVELEDVQDLITHLESQRELWNEYNKVGHIYYNYLLLLKDYLDAN